MPFLGSVHFPLPQSQGGLLGRWQVAGGLRHFRPQSHPPHPPLAHFTTNTGSAGQGVGVQGSPAPAPSRQVYIVYRGVHAWLAWPQHPYFPRFG